MNYLYDITIKNIYYYIYLDFVDLKNLSYVSTPFLALCTNNEILKQIAIANISDLTLPINYDISKPLNELYNAISKLATRNYPVFMKYPKYINRELLINEMIKKVYFDLSSQLKTLRYKSLSTSHLLAVNKMDNIIYINRLILALPFCCYELSCIELYYESNNLYKNDVFLDVAKRLKLPISFIDYLKIIFSHWDLVSHKITDDDFLDILFLNNDIYYIF
jgi:hypothetical protein